MRRRKHVLLVCACALAWYTALAAGPVTMEAKEKPLAAILEQMAASGGARLSPHPGVSEETFSFATRQMSRTSAVRWLCRACCLTVVRSGNGRTFVAKPSVDEAELKQYKVAALLKSDEDAKALVSFIRKVILAAFENREQTGGDARLPEAEALYQNERLKVLAPDVVHKEVLALLQTMAKVKEQGNIEQMTVKYAPYELGYFRGSTGAKPPALKGTVSLELEEATAAEAAWALSSRFPASFYIDTHDPALAKAKVSLVAKDKRVAFAANKVAEALDARLVSYDGAWLFVRPDRRPLFEGLAVKVYYVGGPTFMGFSRGEMVMRRARAELELPQGLPCAIELVGDRLLAAVPAAMHEQLEDFTRWRGPRDRDGRGGPGGPGGRGPGRGRPGR